MDKNSPLNHFHPLVARWFAESVGMPTDVQMLAWPRIAAGEHVLIAAPTGSGKTMAAFLWAINELITGKWPAGRTSVLYVSPLKALIFHVPEDSPHLQSYFGVLHHLLTRRFQPVRRIVIETIKGEDASRSPYRDVLKINFDASPDFRHVVLYQKHMQAGRA